MTKNPSTLVLILALSAPAAAFADSTVDTEGTALDESIDDLAQAAEGSAAEAEAVLEAEADETDDEGDGFELPFSFSIGTGLSMSAGNLRPGLPETEQDDSLLNSWNIGISHEFVDGFSGSLGWGFYKYLTRAGGLELQREARINDLSVGLGYGPIYVIPRADISISASLGAVVPLSRMSRTSTLRTAISPGLSFGRSFGNFNLGYRIGATKRFHRFTSPVVDANEVDALRREGGAEDISANEVALAGVNTEWTWSNGISASYTWIKGFSTSIGWGYARSWGYDVTDCDELSSEFARCGNRIARDSVTGSLSAAYSFAEHYSVSLGAFTAQRPKTSDNRRINFPFWDTQTPGLFNTTLSLDFNASF